MVTLELSKSMDYNISADLAKGNDYGVIVDWAIIENGNMQVVNTTKI